MDALWFGNKVSPAPILIDAGSLKNVVRPLTVPIHFGPDMLPDWSMRKIMSRSMCWAAALVEVQAPPSSTVPPSPGANPPVPPVPAFPEDVLWALVSVAAVVLCWSGPALQPHHAAATQARVSDTKTG